MVETDRRRKLKAGRVVVAMPPTLAGRIVYSPILPALRDQLMQRMPMGFYGKVEVVYPTPFWRAAGLSGQVVSDTGPLRVTFDNSPPDGAPGVLLAFFAGDDGRAWAQLPAAERRAASLESFARYFGDAALSPTMYLEKDWTAEEFSRGDPVGLMPPGVLTRYGPALRAPVGRVHWAGTDRRSGPATWTAPCAPASASRRRSRPPGSAARFAQDTMGLDGLFQGALAGDVRVELNDEPPRLALDRKALFAGTRAPFVAPLAGDRTVSSGGYCSVVPIPFARRLRISTSTVPHWMQITYTRRPIVSPSARRDCRRRRSPAPSR